MTIALHLEALLEAAITSGLCPALRGWSCATGEVLPVQYLLMTRDLPRARARLRCAAEALLVLLDVADGAYYADGKGDHCAKFRALVAAPDWLLRPSEPDDNDPDVALVWECAVTHSGDWQGFLEALHQAGSVEWQWAIRRCRVLMRFEQETEIDLATLIDIPSTNPRHGDGV